MFSTRYKISPIFSNLARLIQIWRVEHWGGLHGLVLCQCTLTLFFCFYDKTETLKNFFADFVTWNNLKKQRCSKQCRPLEILDIYVSGMHTQSTPFDLKITGVEVWNEVLTGKKKKFFEVDRNVQHSVSFVLKCFLVCRVSKCTILQIWINLDRLLHILYQVENMDS